MRIAFTSWNLPEWMKAMIPLKAVLIVLVSLFGLTFSQSNDSVSMDSPEKTTQDSGMSFFPLQLAIVSPIQMVNPNTSITGLRLDIISGENVNVYGIDMGIINKVNRTMAGIEIGAINFTGNTYGFQLGAINLGNTNAIFQVGVFNVTGTVYGIQFGAINITQHLHGLQIGIINICRQGPGASLFPIINAGF
jgi:hypothetical protein